MDFEYTEDQERFRQELREWLRENLPDGWQAGERPGTDDPEESVEFLLDWQQTLNEGGWAGLHWPEEYGGADASLLEQVIYNQETARVDAPARINAVGIDFVGPTLMELGTEEQKERFLPKILSGEELWCQGYSEPDAGSDLASLSLSAERNGDEFLLNGQKVWTSYAHVADWCFLLTRTDESGPKHHGITVFLVDMDQEDIQTEPIHQITDETDFNEVFFDDAVARDEHIVGEIDEGWEVAMTLSAFEHSMSDVFSIEQRWRSLVEFCREHERDGKPLAEHTHVRRELARLHTRIQAGKLTHYRNVSKQMETGVPGPEGSMDKVFNNQTEKKLENFARRLLGANNALWTDGPDDGQWVTDLLMPYGKMIAGGTKDVQRNIIAERVLGLPKDD
ncbi:acyl-CoA dehydrogenase family protein [Halococcus thailandensis]|uniref:Acyl-CoA dehydrogenase n=1 Tax=Halococcus thailandensis JCM 13552 TaxID=1227457 RepID=M0MV69_9EURY|nr:acyl-CoA dehydrogenase family protein [Halococcus thailandensis]EMA49637.1 acyl-CoA dehydrogenase [Halococcus thailandensis JCM 13552]